ncbi:MAG: lipocalin family protein [Pyrinomonadaceae bacterium]|nr:lipocalin family protein [Acidobacteriota bacterium]MBP7375838.1 lipocalin family protein [Pyrinomonadaceae bacterium]
MKNPFRSPIVIILMFTVFAVGSSLTAQTTAKLPELKPVASVDLSRYVGKWYEIGKYPNRFQKQCVANTAANYTMKSNGKIEVRNECTLKDGRIETAIGEAKIADKKTNSKLKVRFAPPALSFLPFVWANYWIIDLDPEYGYVAIGEPKREYFWILSRNSSMDDALYQTILRRAEAMGFNPAKVEKTPQNAEILKGTVTVKN